MSLGTYDKAYIYFDTNTLECRHSGKSLYLSQFTVNTLYYEIEDLIYNLGLKDKVEICIPEIVWLELQEHLVNYFKSERKSMEDKVEVFRKSFGDLAEIYYEFKDCKTESEYLNYANDIAQDFLANPRVNAKIISCPKDEKSMQQIIQQAIHSTRPFRTARAGGKEYTDAGFKDALIFNTVTTHTQNNLGIFISNDNDFSELFNNKRMNNLKMCSNANEVKYVLMQEFDVAPAERMEFILKSDKYLMERILSECQLDIHSFIKDVKIISCENINDNINVDFTATVNEEKYSFDIMYNENANELLEVSCEIYDETEDE